MKGYKMGFLIGCFAVCLVCFLGVMVSILYADELIEKEGMYKYLPPEPSWKEVTNEQEYVRYTNQVRERKVAELHIFLWKVEEILSKQDRKADTKKLQEFYDKCLQDILDYNSPVMPYTANIEAFDKFQKIYMDAKHRENFTTKNQIREWTLADGKRTKFKAVIGAITPKRVIFLSPQDNKIVVAYSRLVKEDRTILREELLNQQRRSAVMRIEAGAQRNSFQPYSREHVPIQK